jgi:molybdopterin molybdotransferase
VNEFTIDAALAHLRTAFASISGTEEIRLAQASGRVLSQPVVAAVDLPAFDNSAMDGYALRAADLSADALREVGHSYAGHGFAGAVQPGECVRIMTGAPLPAGADTVVMLEDTARSAAGVQVLRTPLPGANVRRRGEHVQRGAAVLTVGRLLGPAEIGLAAGSGASTVCVQRRLRVGVASTGDELADPPALLSAATSYDANRPLLLATLRQDAGIDSTDLGICPDDKAAFAALIERALALGLDALVISGGAAQGDADPPRARHCACTDRACRAAPRAAGAAGQCSSSVRDVSPDRAAHAAPSRRCGARTAASPATAACHRSANARWPH